jgi:type IV secretion system protein VirB11
MLATLAAMLETVVNRDNPILEGELPHWGCRFEGVIPPIVKAPAFAIRKKATRIFTLADYVETRVMSVNQMQALQEAVVDRSNILVVGSTGSGKTTLLNALIAEMADKTPDHRFLILEDTAEIQCAAKNVFSMKTAANINMQTLLRVVMRLRPDRILVGETRDGAALALLKAWNTGHPGGISTIHANSAVDGLIRMEQLISEVSQSPMPKLIAPAVNVVVSIKKHGNSRRIDSILRVLGYENEKYITEDIGHPFFNEKHEIISVS